MSAHGWGRPELSVFFLTSFVAMAACGGEEGPENEPDQCLSEGAIRVPVGSDVTRRGAVTIMESRARRVAADGSVAPGFMEQARVVGAFRTFTSTGTDDPFIALGASCAGITGRGAAPESTLEPAGTLTVADIQLQPTDQSTYATTTGFGSLMGEGTPISVTVSGDTFPGFSGSVGAVELLEITAPPTDGTFELTPSGFDLRWTPADGDLINLDITPLRLGGDIGGQVRCILPDSGCFRVGANVASFLRSSNAVAYSIQIQRIRGERFAPADDVEVDLRAVSSVTFGLQAGD